MKTRARYSRILFCVLLIASSLIILFLMDAPAGAKGVEPPGPVNPPEPHNDKTHATSSSTSQTISSSTSQTATPSETAQTTVTMTTTETERATTATIADVPLIPGFVSVYREVIPAMVLAFIIIVLALLTSVLILRSRSSRALDELDDQRRLVQGLRTQPSATVPTTGLTASSALKRLLELGVLEPKEYMEKKMLAERTEKKTSVKQLLDEGLISQQQYDALTRKQE